MLFFLLWGIRRPSKYFSIWASLCNYSQECFKQCGNPKLLCFISSKLTTLFFSTRFNSLHLHLWKLPHHAWCSLHLGRFIIYSLRKQPLRCLDVWKDYTTFVLILMQTVAKCPFFTLHPSFHLWGMFCISKVTFGIIIS